MRPGAHRSGGTGPTSPESRRSTRIVDLVKIMAKKTQPKRILVSFSDVLTSILAQRIVQTPCFNRPVLLYSIPSQNFRILPSSDAGEPLAVIELEVSDAITGLSGPLCLLAARIGSRNWPARLAFTETRSWRVHRIYSTKSRGPLQIESLNASPN